jgi:hypothetical protein
MFQRIGWGWALLVLASCSTFETAPPPPDCLTDRDCTNARVCAQGSCVAACRLDSECAEGEQCVFSRCQLPPAAPLDAGVLVDMQSVDMAQDMTPAVDMAQDMAPVVDMAPAPMVDMAPDMAPMVDMAPAPVVDMQGVDMAPAADMAPVGDMAPVDMAPAADMTP